MKPIIILIGVLTGLGVELVCLDRDFGIGASTASFVGVVALFCAKWALRDFRNWLDDRQRRDD